MAENNGIATLCNAAPDTGIEVFDALRKDAARAVAGIEFPSVRHEDWRFTNLAPVEKAGYKLPAANGGLTGKGFDDRLIKGLGAPALVFVNGVFAPALSSPRETETAAVLPLSEAAKKHGGEVARRLGSLSDCKTEFFTALNTALFEDGAFVLIPEGKTEKEPVYIVHISGAGDTPSVTAARNLIVAGDGARAAVVEHYISADDGNCLSNNLSEVFIGEGGDVEHYRLEFENTGGVHVSTLNMTQERDSNARSHSVLSGGRIVRNNVHPVLAGRGCDSIINGLFMPDGNRHMDNFMKVEHAAPHCGSRQIYNGVLNEKGRGVFHGRIVVHEGAVKTDAKQTNRNLLLSDAARIDTKPQLEIYNDDVKCTHGATIGQMDEDSVFYLRSRGIPEKEARSVILRGFTGESISLMRSEPVRDFVEKESERWFNRALGNG
ncbi:MAG: Fe-S cluster assembly protein SufD [Candidatus Dadabacteria bacterium]|nr:Fe-S cluster assembly protein SufD [Candidatus Dadabacteria bacterium]